MHGGTHIDDDLYYFASLIAKNYCGILSIYDYYGNVDKLFVEHIIKPKVITNIKHGEEITL